MDELLLFPSMMCASFKDLEGEMQRLEKAAVNGYHIDIMDGSFVPNFGMGLQDLTVIRKLTNRMIDVHLMIDDPSQYVQLFADMGVNLIYVHFEADKQIARTLQQIKKNELKVGLAINPGTSFTSIETLLPLIDYLLVMTVNPGFSGQEYLSYVNEKIKKIVAMKDIYGFKVVVDGAISKEKVLQLSKEGVDGFVLGTSALFLESSISYKKTIQELRNEAFVGNG